MAGLRVLPVALASALLVVARSPGVEAGLPASPPDPSLVRIVHPVEEADPAKLALLRARYDLDSVAGVGEDLARITRLTHWVHQRVRRRS